MANRDLLVCALAATGFLSCSVATRGRVEHSTPPAKSFSLAIVMPGTPVSTLFSTIPQCKRIDRNGCSYSAQRPKLPTGLFCEGGCINWTYEFANGIVTSVEGEEWLVDVTPEVATSFAKDAEQVAAALDKQFGQSHRKQLGTWAEIERAPPYQSIPLAERNWKDSSVSAYWKLAGANGRHPTIQWRIRITPDARSAAAKRRTQSL